MQLVERIEQIFVGQKLPAKRQGEFAFVVGVKDLQDSKLARSESSENFWQHYRFLEPLPSSFKGAIVAADRLRALRLRPYDILLSAAGRVARIGFVGNLAYGAPLLPARSLIVIRHHSNDTAQAISLYMWLRSTKGRGRLATLISTSRKKGVRRLSKANLEAMKIPDLEAIRERLVEAFESAQLLRAIIRFGRPTFALLQICPEDIGKEEFVKALINDQIKEFLRRPRVTAKRLKQFRDRVNIASRKHREVTWRTLVANGPYGFSKRGNSRFRSPVDEWVE